MAARHFGWIVILACLLLAGCPSSPPLAPDEIPRDFHFSYEMKVTDEEAYQLALKEKEMKEAAAARPEAPEGTEEAAPEGTEEAAPEGTEEVAPEAGEKAPEEVPDETKGLPVTYVYIVVSYPGHVKYEVHFGFGNPVKRTGSVDLSETAFEKIYRIVRDAEVFQLKKRYIGDLPTGKLETFEVKGNLHWQVIDVKGESVPQLESMWAAVREILLDKESRIFDNPKERSDVFVIDRRNREFHRGNCPKVDDISAEFRIRKNTKQECLNEGAWPCETCRPLDEQ